MKNKRIRRLIVVVSITSTMLLSTVVQAMAIDPPIVNYSARTTTIEKIKK